MDCPFDNPSRERVFHEDDLVVCLWDGYAVSPGHALVITRRHVPDWFDATPAERAALLHGVEIARQEILKHHAPDGFNIGVNVGEAGGQTVFHVHVHVIPRYDGDVDDPRGGVRHVLPGKGNYLLRDSAGPRYTAGEDLGPNLTTGRKSPLRSSLVGDLEVAVTVDIAVAFTMKGGVDLVYPHLCELLQERGGQLRFLTGDYLNTTDPVALRRLLDLDGKAEMRIFQTQQRLSFHPKAYILRFPDGSGRAYIGSSNLSRSALVEGIEWNYRVVSSNAAADFAAIRREFDALFYDQDTVSLDHDWIDKYAERRLEQPVEKPNLVAPELPEEAAEPHAIQAEALAELARTRAAGNTAGLVVLATGLGKTWLSAFDSVAAGFDRVLFVAHREEILGQAMATFRRIRPSARLGRYTGKEKDFDADVLFASVQTLGRLPHLRNFAPDRFDYIVIDEFHHAAARTYRNLINHFEPKFLLGLTATPERTDGGDLLGLCQENLMFRCDLFEGIDRALLSPFQYFGVPDEVDYQNIPWRSTRFDEQELEAAVATEARATNALEHLRNKGGKRTIAFCCSKPHADFMSAFFVRHGLRSAAVHSGETSAPRAASLERLESGELEVVCAVDMFNEGVDVPTIDTVLMLRPTESSILWTQQVGRGLRRAEGKERLVVIDYIGNHRIFLTKVRSLFGLDAREASLRMALRDIKAEVFELPTGCEVTYDLRAIEILESLVRTRGPNVLESYYTEYRQRLGQRPTALEAFHDGYNPRHTGGGRWLEFVREMGDLEGESRVAYETHGEFFRALEVTQMTKSFKMLVLLGMLNEDCFPGEISVDQLAHAVNRIASRAEPLRREFGETFDDVDAFRNVLVRNPIAAWAGGRGMGEQYFAFDGDLFSSTMTVEPQQRESFQEFTREISEWRLAEYQSRAARRAQGGDLVCKIIHANGRPIIKLPDREQVPAMPWDWTPVSVDGRAHEAKFAKIAINVLREQDGDSNVLPQVLRGWFGPDAGQPGTTFNVRISPEADGYSLSPVNPIGTKAAGLELWRPYSREQIPTMFGLAFSTGSWNQGFVVQGGHVFLLVTLSKDDMQEGHRYADHFESASIFHWQSQNRTKQDSYHGRIIRGVGKNRLPVHLFIRKSKKTGSNPAPFHYCGEVELVDWEGEQPISVRWRLAEPLSDSLWAALRL